MIRLLFLVTLLVLTTPGVTEAQFSPDLSAITGEALSIELNPAFPAPGETVTATIDDYASGITNGSIIWFMNGAVATGTENQRTVEFVAGSLGSRDVLSVQIRNTNGFTQNASRVISPRYLDIIVEPQTYTPQGYRGRGLPVHDSLVRVTALLHDEQGIVNAQNLNYLWRVNNTTLGGGNSRGAFQSSYAVPHGRNHTVTLEIYDQNNDLLIRRAVNVTVGAVDIRLYEDSPLYGLSYTTLRNPHNFIGNGVTLRAVPYNLDVRAVNRDLFTEWSINDRTVRSGDDPFEITLERSGTGVANISFKLRNRVSLLQGGEVRALLQF